MLYSVLKRLQSKREDNLLRAEMEGRGRVEGQGQTQRAEGRMCNFRRASQADKAIVAILGRKWGRGQNRRASEAYKSIVAILGQKRAGEPLSRKFPVAELTNRLLPFSEVVLYGLQMLTNADIMMGAGQWDASNDISRLPISPSFSSR